MAHNYCHQISIVIYLLFHIYFIYIFSYFSYFFIFRIFPISYIDYIFIYSIFEFDCSIPWPWLIFSSWKKLKCYFLRDLEQNAKDNMYRFLYLPSTGIIGNVVLCDLELHFQCRNNEMLQISLKRWELEQKCKKRLLKIWIFTNEWYYCESDVL